MAFDAYLKIEGILARRLMLNSRIRQKYFGTLDVIDPRERKMMSIVKVIIKSFAVF